MRLPAILSVALLSLAACGDDGGSMPGIDSAPGDDAQAGSDATIDTPSGAFTLTSTAYAEGGVIPSAQACANRGGMNQSPPLAWSNPPAGTMSFAIVFTDRTINPDLIHSAIYDIPSSASSLPGNVDKVYAPTAVPGAHHPAAYNGTRGYEGPCPNTPHMYEHKIYALATATVPNSTMGTTRMQLVTELEANNLGSTTLTATFTPP